MLYNSKNGKIDIDNTTVDYIFFGKGQNNLIVIPGLGDGIKTVKGLALPLAYMYKTFAKDYKVYMFSRRNNLYDGFSTSNMADDIAQSMDLLNISSADFLGVSQGGMIAQCVAIQYPEKVNKLILAVTSSKANNTIEETLNFWIKKAKEKDYKSIFIDTAEKTYTEKYLKRYRKFYGILCNVGKPKDFKRFIIQAEACLTHNMYNELGKIETPTLVIGASDDKIVGVNASQEIADKIKNSELYIYDGYGHGVYEEAKDFNTKILKYLKK